jgi:hypothetical protein
MSARPRELLLDAVAATLEAAGLAPVIDRAMDVVRSECPACRAGWSDPRGLWRPMVVVPRDDRLVYRCESCGRRRHA